MHHAREHDPILDRVDGSVGLIGGGNGDQTTEVTVIPLPLVCQRKYMSRFEPPPPADMSKHRLVACYNASPISLEHSIAERFNTSPRGQRNRTN